MEFRLNRNNQMMNVELQKGEKILAFSKVKVASGCIPELEAILNGEKTPDVNSFLMLEELEMTEEEYAAFKEPGEITGKADALTFAERYIYCFELTFGKLTLEKIGNKKKVGDNMVLKNIKMKMWPKGIYSAKEVSGLAEQMEQDKEVEISVPTGDHQTYFFNNLSKVYV